MRDIAACTSQRIQPGQPNVHSPTVWLRSQLYSYGAPFPGNRAFRKDFDEAIPEAHNVIVDGVRPGLPAPLCAEPAAVGAPALLLA